LDKYREHVPGSLTGQWPPASWGLDLDRAEDSNPHPSMEPPDEGPRLPGCQPRTVARTWRYPNRGCAVGLRGPAPRGVDPELLLGWMHDRIDTSSFRGRRHVVRVAFTDGPRPEWIVIERGIASVCPTDPGHPVGFTMSSSAASGSANRSR
jgi:hypothetical protein